MLDSAPSLRQAIAVTPSATRRDAGRSRHPRRVPAVEPGPRVGGQEAHRLSSVASAAASENRHYVTSRGTFCVLHSPTPTAGPPGFALIRPLHERRIRHERRCETRPLPDVRPQVRRRARRGSFEDVAVATGHDLLVQFASGFLCVDLASASTCRGDDGSARRPSAPASSPQGPSPYVAASSCSSPNVSPRRHTRQAPRVPKFARSGREASLFAPSHEDAVDHRPSGSASRARTLGAPSPSLARARVASNFALNPPARRVATQPPLEAGSCREGDHRTPYRHREGVGPPRGSARPLASCRNTGAECCRARVACQPPESVARVTALSMASRTMTRQLHVRAPGGVGRS